MSEEKRVDKLREKLAELEELKEEYVPISDVRELVAGVRNLFEGKLEGEELKLYGELGELAKYINDARKELKLLSDNEVGEKEIVEASDQLSFIVQHTEEATKGIMDAGDQLQRVLQRVIDKLISHEPPLNEDVLIGIDDAMNDAETNITKIYEACTFQDLTGQRIYKIINVLREVERQILRMVVVFGLNNAKVDDETRRELKEEVDLLEGPGMPGSSLGQDDIDDILNKLL